jgi:hypothetical protein
MSHYVPESRLASRKSATPSEWLPTCSQIGELANAWSGRSDLAVYAGTDAGMGQAIACFIGDTAEIEINLEGAFGSATTPQMIGDLRKRENQYEVAEPVGVIYHEALHARYSDKWDKNLLASEKDNDVVEAFFLLEESRIERYGVIEMPQNQLFLRASALGLALGELDEERLTKISEVRVMAHLAGLALARVDAGVVKLSDVATTYDKALEILGEELFDELRALWCEFQQLRNGETFAGMEIARKWVKVLDTKDPEGKNGGAGSLPEFVKDLLDALGEDASGTGISVAMDLADQQMGEDWKEEVSKKQNDTKKKNEAKKESDEVMSKSNGSLGSASRSSLVEQRNPNSNERASAVKIGQMLEKAKYRERSETVVKSHEPVGRLKTRVAIQNKALESKGVRELAPAWRKTTRKHTDDPTLSMGIMVDISGSMGSAMESMATTAWVMSEAGRRIQAKTAMVYYGSDVFPTLKVGQKLDKVSVYSAPDGTEMFHKAFMALDGSLNLSYGNGVRILVIVSDGNYTGNETEHAKNVMRACEQNGVAVLFITPKACMSHGAKEIMKATASGVHLDELDVEQIALEIGRSASEALAKVSA